MNPFEYGKIVEGKHFCGRKDLIRQITGHIESGQNLFVTGLRRVGKSSLVNEAVRKSPKHSLLKIDLMGIRSTDSLCRRILTEIVVYEQNRGWLEKIFKTLAHLRPVIGTDPITMLPHITFDTALEIKEESIPALLSLLETLGKKSKLIVFFDEFQDVLKMSKEESYEVLALMRGKIQYQKNISYIYAGSVRHKMEEIFTHSDSPFFKSAIPITVDPIPYEDFSSFIKKKFREGNKEVSTEAIQKIFEIADSIPGDIQQICNALWEVAPEGESIGPEGLKSAIDLIFSREQKAYADYVNLLTDKQMKCLTAIAKIGGKNVQATRFLTDSGLKLPATVKRSIARLESINILFEHKNEYRFVNPFFRAWLLYNSR